jgi:small subunit ribosomal protein S13
MARIAGVDIPREKRLEISLTYIFGIGLTTSQTICKSLELDPNTKVSNLTEDEINQIRSYVDQNLTIEGDLRRNVQGDIKRTRKGPKRTVANKKKAVRK